MNCCSYRIEIYNNYNNSNNNNYYNIVNNVYKAFNSVAFKYMNILSLQYYCASVS